MKIIKGHHGIAIFEYSRKKSACLDKEEADALWWYFCSSIEIATGGEILWQREKKTGIEHLMFAAKKNDPDPYYSIPKLCTQNGDKCIAFIGEDIYKNKKSEEMVVFPGEGIEKIKGEELVKLKRQPEDFLYKALSFLGKNAMLGKEYGLYPEKIRECFVNPCSERYKEMQWSKKNRPHLDLREILRKRGYRDAPGGMLSPSAIKIGEGDKAIWVIDTLIFDNHMVSMTEYARPKKEGSWASGMIDYIR